MQSLPRVSSIREVNGQLFRCFSLPSWQIRRLSYQAPVLREIFSLLRVSRHICTSDIRAFGLCPHMPTRWARPGSGPDSSQH